MLNTFVETDTLVLLRKKPLEVTTQLIKEALGLLKEVITKPQKNYAMANKISKKGSMEHVKDVLDLDMRPQFHLYMQNIALMAKTEDMSTKNYNR